MQVFDGSGRLPDSLRGGVVALGNFDGFHRGHQAVVGAAGRVAGNKPLGMLTFTPHPVRYFKPELPPFMLSSDHQKADLLRQFGADYAVFMPFNQLLAEVTAEEFASLILVDQLGCSHVVCGDDFTYGHKRGGSAKLLIEQGARLGFGVTALAPVGTSHQSAYASTVVRKALEAGQPKAAAESLGRWWSIEGIVEHGDARGRTIGFPTANLGLSDYQRPHYGVYAVRLEVAGRMYDGVANIGTKPTFNPPRELVEVHIFDFADDIYEKVVQVELVEFIRKEQRFDGLDALKQQIAIDSATARKILRQQGYSQNRFPVVTRANFA